MRCLGISCYYHDAACAIVENDHIIAAAQEERFTRIKHDPGFPLKSLEYCMFEAGMTIDHIDRVVFYDKPLLKFERLLETYVSTAPKGFGSFFKAMSVWLTDKIWIEQRIRKALNYKGELLFPSHHLSHAASVFYPSPFQEALIITADGVGEFATTTIGVGKGSEISWLKEIHFPHSLGLLYSAFTYYTGFKVNSGEYKVMGLAPYGESKYVDLILKHLIDVKEDGSFRLDMSYFDYMAGFKMTSQKFHELFGHSPRQPESKLTQFEMDIARSLQDVTERVMEKIVRHGMKETGLKNVCLSGGVALNCVSNGKLLSTCGIENIFIQPASGDAGGALGAALYGYFVDHDRTPKKPDALKGSFLGPSFRDNDIQSFLHQNKYPYEILADETKFTILADIIASGHVLGLFQGRMEFGPRALGGRSILADPRNKEMQKTLNLKIKFRESFRPFAPMVLREDCHLWFELQHESPYMLLVANVNPRHRVLMTEEQSELFGIEKINVPRSSIPSVTHVDYSARIQTVDEERNPFCYHLLKAFKELTGVGVLVNTSFNVRGEPIVCTPEEAYACFMRTDMEYLVLEKFLLKKESQPIWKEKENWQEHIPMD